LKLPTDSLAFGSVARSQLNGNALDGLATGTSMDADTPSSRLEKAREAIRLDQHAVAALIGINTPSYCDLEAYDDELAMTLWKTCVILLRWSERIPWSCYSALTRTDETEPNDDGIV
jgi:DNA-binding XRE family transcriptional regulator